MVRFTSGFIDESDTSKLFAINTRYYPVDDDLICFQISCIYHHIANAEINPEYEIKRAKITPRKGGHPLDIWVEFDENGEAELRVYRVTIKGEPL